MPIKITALVCLLSVTTLIAGQALAAQTIDAREAGAKAPVSQPSDVVSTLRPASLFKPGETIAQGDLVAVSRLFGDWTMHCEMRLSTNRKICAIEQPVTGEGGGLVWRITESETGSLIVLLSLPTDMLPEQGLHLNFLDLEKTIARRHWQCSGAACLAVLPFDGIVQAAIRQAAEIGFTYTAHADDGQERIVHLSAHMNGFAEALQAIRDNPFGQQAAQPASSGSSAAEVRTPGPQTEPQKHDIGGVKPDQHDSSAIPIQKSDAKVAGSPSRAPKIMPEKSSHSSHDRGGLF